MAKDKPNWRVTLRYKGKEHTLEVNLGDTPLHLIANACRSFAKGMGEQLVRFERIKS